MILEKKIVLETTHDVMLFLFEAIGILIFLVVVIGLVILFGIDMIETIISLF